MIVIVDYGMGNLSSIQQKFKKLRLDAIISNKTEDILRADKLILPGVGHFAYGMKNLLSGRLIPVLSQKVLDEKTPILGICLGMQLLTKRSEEGDCEGLGWIKAQTVRFDFEQSNMDLRVPHVSWNAVFTQKESLLLNGIDNNTEYYFTHSYYVKCEHEENVLAVTKYGITFASIIQVGNIYGIQFHPEKSHQGGMILLQNFGEKC